MLATSAQSEMLFGDHKVLVSANHLVNQHNIRRIYPQEVTYIHLLFDHQKITPANGTWTETINPEIRRLTAWIQS